MIKLDESRNFTIGRKGECDISIDDASVSRLHCALDWDAETGTFCLIDCNSKFGTLVKKSCNKIENQLLLQKGRVKMKFT